MDDMRLAALLCTRLCHDVIGPAGATVNGIELLSEDVENVDDAVVDLVQQSAGETTRRLKFFRIAFGEAVDGQSLADARALADGFLEHGKADLDWPDAELDAELDAEMNCGGRRPPTLVPLVLNLVLCASEALPRGGTIGVRIGAGDGGVLLVIEASGPAIKLDDATVRSLAGESDLATLDARGISPYYAARLAAAGGGAIDVAATTDSAKFSVTLRRSA